MHLLPHIFYRSQAVAGDVPNRKRPGVLSCGLLLLMVLWVCSLQSIQAGGIVREVFRNIPGLTLADLTNSPTYPTRPSLTNLITTGFEAPSFFDDQYGQRLHGYITAPVSGEYTFWISGDDVAELYLSTDEDSRNARKIAAVSHFTAPRAFDTEPSQKSAPILLEAGKNYYICALHKENTGSDHLSVRWLRPDGVDQIPIPGGVLLPFGSAVVPPLISQAPVGTTVMEGDTAVFAVQVKNQDPVRFQWQRDGVDIPGATVATLSLPQVGLVDSGSRFSVVVFNALGSLTNSEVVLLVAPDTRPPQLLGAASQGLSSVLLTFSEPLDPVTASDPVHFTLSSDAMVVAAARLVDPKQVLLTTSSLEPGKTYTVQVEGVMDLAQTPNPMSAANTASFQAMEWTAQVIGNSVTTLERISPTSFDLSGGPGDLGSISDQFQMAWERRSGNFDLQVRVASLGLVDPFSRAGFMARADLKTNSAYAAVLAASEQVGCLFQSRAGPGQAITMNGRYPVNYPQTWLRLRRVGTSFTGFASQDGQTWFQLGSATISLPNTLYLGLVLGSSSTTRGSQVQFRDYGTVTSTKLGSQPKVREPMGPTSRRTGLVFSEIHYHPRPPAGITNNLEFVELHNADVVFEDLTGWTLAGGISITFPRGTVLPSSGYLVVAKDPAAVRQVYGITNVIGPFSGSLGNEGDSLELRDTFGAIKLQMKYQDKSPWPISPDGAGHSLVLSRPSYGEADPRAWSASDQVGGSPGRMDPVTAFPQRGVVINEFLVHPKPSEEGYVELYNATAEPIDLGGCFISDNTTQYRFQIPVGETIPALGFLRYGASQLGFLPSAAGGDLYLVTPDKTRVVDSLRFEDQQTDVASGRSPDGAPTVRRLSQPTPGQPNAPWRVEDVVLNEIMYAPISGNPDDQFVELYNRSESPVKLEGWRFVDGWDFKFPDGLVLPAGGYLVVSPNPQRLISHHAHLNSGNTIGGFSNRLPKGGRLALAGTDMLIQTNSAGLTEKQILHPVVSEVVYVEGGRWGKYANEGGSSLELIDPRADLLRPSSWADSDETAKAPWTSFSFTGTFDNANAGVPLNRVYLLLQGMGECLVDDIGVAKVNSTNLVANGGFESGTNTWLFSGDHERTTVDTIGAATGERCLHLRSQNHGDTGINSVRAPLTAALVSRNQVELTAKARWLAGWPEVLMRIRGNGIEMPMRLTVPDNLGTPGLPNSRRVENAGPAIFDVAHTPALPRANEAVVISCRVSDADGIARVVARYRIEPSNSTSELLLHDDGQLGDAVAGDGIYSGRLTGRGAGTQLGFRILATDGSITGVTSIFPSTQMLPVGLPYPECYIRWEDPVPGGNFAHYHLWNSVASDAQRRAALNNTYRDATLVYGDFRVVYNVGFRDKGSPFHGGAGSYALTGPDDEPLLGVTDRVFRSTGNGGPEDTGLRNLLCSWIGQQMHIPHLHGFYMRLFRNGSQIYTLTQDEEYPNRHFAKSWFPDSGDEDLYKIAVWFEFQDDNNAFASTSATLENFRGSTGEKKLARYRWNWQTRGFGGTANNFTNIFNLVNVMNDTSANNVANLMNTVDVQEWARIFAFHRVIGNWDSWTFNVGQNMYIMKPENQGWVLMPWDIDFTLGLGNAASDGLFTAGQDPVMNRWFNNAAFRRMMWRAYREAVSGPMVPENFSPVIDARRQALLRNSIAGLQGPNGVSAYLNQRRTYILTQIQIAEASQFAITTNGGSDFDSPSDTVTLRGTAPFDVYGIAVNGVPVPVTWPDQKTFSITVPLSSAVNTLRLTGIDSRGNAIAGFESQVRVSYSGTSSRPKVTINELMASNGSTLLDPATGKNEDWFELHNADVSTVDLTGYALTLNPANPVQFVIPSGFSIPPGGFLLVWADEMTSWNTNLDGALHVNFKLDKGGGQLALLGTDRVLMDQVTYGPQTQDVSIGRFPDGNTAVLEPMGLPTPANPNSGGISSGFIRLHASRSSADQVTLTWASQVGAGYRVEYATSLGGTWELLQQITAAGNTTSVLDPFSAQQGRFYRLTVPR